ncbi:MAG TPA: AMP-binding protein [Solirubrobacterales bacterium]|nr:AMP-binding protein [Solirubrobacterales bacterium]
MARGRIDPGLLTRTLAGLGRANVGSLGQLADVPFNLRMLAQAGVIRPMRPDKVARVARELRRWGASPAAGIAAAAATRGDAPMVEDESGTLSFAEIHRRSNALARGLRDARVGEGDGVAIMCRNHRGFIESTLAAAKLGATGLYMNTAFAAPQLAGVVESERPRVLIYDEEFAGLLADAGGGIRRYVAWRDRDGARGDAAARERAAADPTIDELIAASPAADLEPPERAAKFVILTSGTTGTPKGAQRSQPDSLAPVAAMFSRIPLRARERTVIAAPMFHSWGFVHFALGLSLTSTYVLRRRFDPEQTLRAVADSRAAALIVVPVMMQRILELPDDVIRRYDVSSLRVTAASGSALPGPLATRWMDTFGDNLYNLYGSTEVAWATIATPEDLRAAPGTAGRPPRGTKLLVVDEDGEEVPPGTTGRVFVGNQMAFEGYTGGGGKEALAGLLSSGDVGHRDAEGRLFIDGRDDEMIVSGGENVFPREVEDLLAGHEAVREVAVVGVDDEEFGQRLKAFVAVYEGASLSEADVRDLVKANLARFKVPRDVEFVDSLPRNATGKVLKRELV